MIATLPNFYVLLRLLHSEVAKYTDTFFFAKHLYMCYSGHRNVEFIVFYPKKKYYEKNLLRPVALFFVVVVVICFL